MSDEEKIFENAGDEPDSLSGWDELSPLIRLQETLRLSRIPSNEVPRDQDVTDNKVLAEEATFEAGKRQAELAKLHAELEGLKQDTLQRKAYAGRIFWLNVAWIALLAAIVLLSGFSWTRFSLPASVLLALVGTTTLNILGTLYIVAQYLFPKKH